MNRFIPLAIVITVAAPAVPAFAQAMSGKTYVAKAGASDLFEKDASRLMLASANPRIKQFANKMITDHTQSTKDVKAAAMKAGMHPAPPMLNAQQSHMIAQLRAAHGTARDSLYLTQQKAAHQQALQLHQSYAADGKVQPLKMAAGKIAPVVQSHIDMLNSMGSM